MRHRKPDSSALPARGQKEVHENTLARLSGVRRSNSRQYLQSRDLEKSEWDDDDDDDDVEHETTQ